jgi:hypothetical protein
VLVLGRIESCATSPSIQTVPSFSIQSLTIIATVRTG